MPWKEKWREFRTHLSFATFWWLIGGDKLLDWIRNEVTNQWRKYLGGVVTAIIVSIVAWLRHLQWPMVIILVLGSFVLVLFIWDMAAGKRTISAAQRNKTDERQNIAGANPFQLIRAEWGVNGQLVDVTRTIQDIISNGTTTIRASTEVFGDPVHGHHKILFITYGTGKGPVRIRIHEGESRELPVTNRTIRPPHVKLISPEQTVKNHEIRFDYLPGSPLDNGWKLAYPNPKPPGFSLKLSRPPDLHKQDGITIIANETYGIDYSLPSSLSSCDRLNYHAKDLGELCVFTKVELSSRDGSQVDEKLIKYTVGYGAPAPTKGVEQNEWTLPIAPVQMPNSWISFDIFLPDAVERTWGRDGWVYKRVTAIRLRGNFSISPIELYETVKLPSNKSQPEQNVGNSGIVQLQEIYKDFRAARLTNPDISATQQKFIGVHVDWHLKFMRSEPNAQTGTTRVLLYHPDHRGDPFMTCECFVSQKDYPGLWQFGEDDPVRITGMIEGFWMGIQIGNAKLFIG